jgi:hypothetical protein
MIFFVKLNEILDKVEIILFVISCFQKSKNIHSVPLLFEKHYYFYTVTPFFTDSIK